MKKATKFRNIGSVSRRWLAEIEIDSIEELRRLGAVLAFRLIKAHHPEATLNLLWALEAALLDMDWRELPSELKQNLKIRAMT